MERLKCESYQNDAYDPQTPSGNGKARPQADERQARPADERLSGAGP